MSEDFHIGGHDDLVVDSASLEMPGARPGYFF